MDALKEFAQQYEGNYIEQKYDKLQKAKFQFNGFNIIFDYHINYISGTVYQQKFTRITASFIALNDFQFQIYRNDLISSITKFFGSQDFEIGNSEFDKAFVIKTNNEFKMKSLLTNNEIMKAIQRQEDINFHISKQRGIWEEKLPKNEFELSFYSEKIIEDIEQLKSLLDLFKETLNHLIEINSIQAKSITS